MKKNREINFFHETTVLLASFSNFYYIYLPCKKSTSSLFDHHGKILFPFVFDKLLEMTIESL